MPQRTPDQAGYNLATEVLTRKVVFTGEEQEYFLLALEYGIEGTYGVGFENIMLIICGTFTVPPRRSLLTAACSLGKHFRVRTRQQKASSL
jgi:hypothetical protein